MLKLKEIKMVSVNRDETTTWLIMDEANITIHVNRPSNESLAMVATLAEAQTVQMRLLNRVIGVSSYPETGLYEESMLKLKEVEKIRENENGTTTWRFMDMANMEVHVNRPSNETFAQVVSLAEEQKISIRYLNRAIGNGGIY